MALARLLLTDFRNHEAAALTPGAGFVVLTGDNGAGKTNVLEAVSLLAPGRGLRRAPLPEIARQGGSGGFAVAAPLTESIEIGTGTQAAAPERRIVRVNGAAAAATGLSEWLTVLWLTPAMDRLFVEPASERRRFLDRLTLALAPGHAHHTARYEAAMRERNRLLGADEPADPDWLTALEARMAEHGAAIDAARRTTVKALAARLEEQPEGPFARAGLLLEGDDATDLAQTLRAGRGIARSADRTARTCRSPISARLSLHNSVRPVSKRRCCSASSSPMPNSSPIAPAARPSCCSTRSPHISTPAAGTRCSSGWPDAGKCG